jgi:hypothetical protein
MRRRSCVRDLEETLAVGQLLLRPVGDCARGHEASLPCEMGPRRIRSALGTVEQQRRSARSAHSPSGGD